MEGDTEEFQAHDVVKRCQGIKQAGMVANLNLFFSRNQEWWGNLEIQIGIRVGSHQKVREHRATFIASGREIT
jgi:hypothetical protein